MFAALACCLYGLSLVWFGGGVFVQGIPQNGFGAPSIPLKPQHRTKHRKPPENKPLLHLQVGPNQHYVSINSQSFESWQTIGTRGIRSESWGLPLGCSQHFLRPVGLSCCNLPRSTIAYQEYCQLLCKDLCKGTPHGKPQFLINGCHMSTHVHIEPPMPEIQ